MDGDTVSWIYENKPLCKNIFNLEREKKIIEHFLLISCQITIDQIESLLYFDINSDKFSAL